MTNRHRTDRQRSAAAFGASRAGSQPASAADVELSARLRISLCHAVLK